MVENLAASLGGYNFFCATLITTKWISSRSKKTMQSFQLRLNTRKQFSRRISRTCSYLRKSSTLAGPWFLKKGPRKNQQFIPHMTSRYSKNRFINYRPRSEHTSFLIPIVPRHYLRCEWACLIMNNYCAGIFAGLINVVVLVFERKQTYSCHCECSSTTAISNYRTKMCEAGGTKISLFLLDCFNRLPLHKLWKK